MKISELPTSLCWWLLLSAVAVAAEKWTWPDQQQKQHNIDGKLKFQDEPLSSAASAVRDTRNHNSNDIANDEVDEVPFISQGIHQSSGDTGPGRRAEKYIVNPEQNFPGGSIGNTQDYNDGTLDTVRACRCLHTKSCLAPDIITPGSCGAGQSLCCRDRVGKPVQQDALESSQRLVLAGPGGPTGIIGPIRQSGKPSKGVLVGPEGPTGIIGPTYFSGGSSKRILVGPEGPTGIIGPNYSGQFLHGSLSEFIKRPLLVGPGGPTGIVGPAGVFQRPNNGILTGPDGPTGVIGPNSQISRPTKNGILVGPGGPTGLIGPAQRPILVGPGGPTGVIGPSGFRTGNHNGVLVGPGGPTGIIGPTRNNHRQYNRGILIGPGGPTGILGPSRYYNY